MQARVYQEEEKNNLSDDDLPDADPYPQNVYPSKRGYAIVIGNGYAPDCDIRKTCHKDADVMEEAFNSAGKKKIIILSCGRK